MIFLCIFFIIFLLFFTKILIIDKLQRKVINIFFLIWGTNLIISCLNPLNLFEVRSTTYFTIFLSLFFFLVGSLLINRNIISKEEGYNNYIFFDKIQLLNKNFIIITLLILSTIQIISYYLKYQQIVLIYGIEGARIFRFFAGPLFSTTSEIFIFNYYFELLSIFCILYFSVCLVFEKLNFLSVLCLVYCYFFSSIGAGRFFLVETSLYILLIFFTKKYYYKIKTPKKVITILVSLLISLYLLSIYFVNFRRGYYEINFQNFKEGNLLLLEHSIIYNVGAINALDYGLTNYSNIENTFFRLYLGGLDEFISTLLNFLGVEYTSANSIYGNLVYEPIQIGVNNEFNALYTNILPMYIDLGILGVILCSLVNGYLFSFFYYKFKRSPQLFNFLIFIFFTIQMYFSVFNWGFSSVSAWLFSLICIIINKWQKQKLFF